MYIDIPMRHLRMISEAIDVQVRLLNAYINRTDADELKIIGLKDLKERIDRFMLSE